MASKKAAAAYRSARKRAAPKRLDPTAEGQPQHTSSKHPPMRQGAMPAPGGFADSKLALAEQPESSNAWEPRAAARMFAQSEVPRASRPAAIRDPRHAAAREAVSEETESPAGWLIQVRHATVVAEQEGSRAWEPREAAHMLAQVEVPERPRPANAKTNKAAKMQPRPACLAGRKQHRYSPSPWKLSACDPCCHAFALFCIALSDHSGTVISPAPCSSLTCRARVPCDQGPSLLSLKAWPCLRPQFDRQSGGLKRSSSLTDVFIAGGVIGLALCLCLSNS